MCGNLGFEISQALPVQPLLEIDFRNGHRAKLVRDLDRLSIMTVNRGSNPLLVGRRVRTADQIHVVFTSSCSGQKWIAAPNRPRNDFRPIFSESLGHLGKETVVANHHADFADRGIKHRVFVSGRNAPFDLAAGQSRLALGLVNIRWQSRLVPM